MAKAKSKLPYVMVRTYSAGVFAGELVSRKGQEVILKNARRIWYWAGAAMARADWCGPYNSGEEP